MHALLGDRLFPEEEEAPLSEVIRGGHDELVLLLGVDLGYDPKQWHDYLCVFDEGGYRWSNKHLHFPSRIAEVEVDPAWRNAVAELRSTTGAAARPAD
jgi:hypothetical protein